MGRGTGKAKDPFVRDIRGRVSPDMTAKKWLGLGNVSDSIGREADLWSKTYEAAIPPPAIRGEKPAWGNFGDALGPGDAYRHMLLGGELRRKYGQLLGAMLASGHELTIDMQEGRVGEDSAENRQDYMNNARGSDLAADAESFDDVKVAAKKALFDALMKRQEYLDQHPNDKEFKNYYAAGDEPVVLSWGMTDWPKIRDSKKTEALHKRMSRRHGGF